MSREQILTMPEEMLRKLAELVPSDYDPDAPVELRIGKWLTRPLGEGGE